MNPQFVTKNRGQILIEVLIGIVILAIVGVLITEMSLIGFRSTKHVGVESVMIALAQEGLEAVEAVQASDWHNIYDLTKATQEYYPKISGGVWTLTTIAADKTITLDGVSYQRWIILNNVSRDMNDDIVTSGGTDDPSTQKVTVFVSAPGVTNNVSYVRYFSRSRNTTAVQTDWGGGSGQATNPTSGFDANFNNLYDTGDGNLDTAGAELKLLQ